MTGRLVHSFLGVGALLAAGCAQDTTVTRGLKEAPQLQATLLAAIPPGTQVPSAVAFMERNNFRCLDQHNALWGDRQKLDYVYCDKEVDAAWPIVRRWQVALVHAGSERVQEVLVSTGLVGP
jgi:hypothetical protein